MCRADSHERMTDVSLDDDPPIRDCAKNQYSSYPANSHPSFPRKWIRKCGFRDCAKTQYSSFLRKQEPSKIAKSARVSACNACLARVFCTVSLAAPVAGRTYVQDVRADNCSCVICTSAFHGGRMPILHRYMDSLLGSLIDILSITCRSYCRGAKIGKVPLPRLCKKPTFVIPNPPCPPYQGGIE